MFPKILVPLDGSVEAETTVSRIQEELSSDGTIILLQVIPPAKGLRVGEHTIQTTQQEEANRATSLAYLRSVAEKQSIQPKKWHFEVSVSDSVAEEIANVALRERADLVQCSLGTGGVSSPDCCQAACRRKSRIRFPLR
jgi:nucleotide-binding universal stress UspA family protein